MVAAPPRWPPLAVSSCCHRVLATFTTTRNVSPPVAFFFFFFQVSTTFYTSSGETVDFQRFSSFAEGGDLMAKAVVLVGYGNSVNDWNR